MSADCLIQSGPARSLATPAQRKTRPSTTLATTSTTARQGIGGEVRPLALRARFCHAPWSAGGIGQREVDMTTLDADRMHVDDLGAPDLCTSTFDALGHRFAVACDDARTASLVEEAFSVFAVSRPPLGRYEVRRDVDRIHLRWMDHSIGELAEPAQVLPRLRSHVQRKAIAAADADLVLRAGCAELDGRAVVLSGAHGSGVSTLLA